MRGRFRAAACVALLAGALGAAEPVTVPVTEVALVADRRAKTYPGRIVPVAQVDVVPQVSGEILAVAFSNGAVVKAGTVLYRIDPVKYQAAAKNCEAKVTELKAAALYAERSFERYQSLKATRAVSQDAVDSTLSQRDTARASLAAAEADLLAARDALGHCTIVAPIDGKLGTTAKTPGNYVAAGGDPLVRIVQSAPVRVRFSISNREFLDLFGGLNRRIRAESVVTLTLANGSALGETGFVEYVDNEADELTDTVWVYALFPNGERRLKPGGTVVVTLTASQGARRPAVPPTAVLQDTQGPFVWTLDAGTNAVRRTIARGDLVGDWLFVEKGLKGGERIVADGAHRVHAGDAVRPAPAADGKGAVR